MSPPIERIASDLRRLGAEAYRLHGDQQMWARAFIVSANSFRCVNVRGGSTANGAEIIQYDCVNAYNNHWRFA